MLTDRHDVGSAAVPGRRRSVCVRIIFGTTQLPSGRQRSQVARQAAVWIMVNAFVAFNALPGDFFVDRSRNSATKSS
jgi:hypothetical protein